MRKLTISVALSSMWLANYAWKSSAIVWLCNCTTDISWTNLLIRLTSDHCEINFSNRYSESFEVTISLKRKWIKHCAPYTIKWPQFVLWYSSYFENATSKTAKCKVFNMRVFLNRLLVVWQHSNSYNAYNQIQLQSRMNLLLDTQSFIEKKTCFWSIIYINHITK